MSWPSRRTAAEQPSSFVVFPGHVQSKKSNMFRLEGADSQTLGGGVGYSVSCASAESVRYWLLLPRQALSLARLTGDYEDLVCIGAGPFSAQSMGRELRKKLRMIQIHPIISWDFGIQNKRLMVEWCPQPPFMCLVEFNWGKLGNTICSRVAVCFFVCFWRVSCLRACFFYVGWCSFLRSKKWVFLSFTITLTLLN